MRSDREAKEADFEATKAEMTDTRSARLARLSGEIRYEFGSDRAMAHDAGHESTATNTHGGSGRSF